MSQNPQKILEDMKINNAMPLGNGISYCRYSYELYHGLLQHSVVKIHPIK